MVWTALLLSRLQFAFAVSFHIIFPSFPIGLAAWLTVEAFHLITGKPVYRRLFEFWLKIFGVMFGMGVVSGIVLAFEFGMNWSRLSEATGPIQGPLLTYESFTAFALEASLPILTIGVLVFLAIAFVAALLMHLNLMSRWLERPYLLIFPLIGAISALGLLKAARQQNDLAPFRFAILIFAAAFGTLACSFWPFMIPFALTVEQAAAPPASLAFTFWGAGPFVMPLTLIYAAVVYCLFRGKVVDAQIY